MANQTDQGLPARVVGIGASVGLMVAILLIVGPRVLPRQPESADEAVPGLTPASEPIASEADVFRMQPGDFGADPDPLLQVRAHRRTLAVHRKLRAFPGAPPRIPHGLTEQEFQSGTCNTCHERGGFVDRFATYAPVTPHPEMGQCLQCHVADDRFVGVAVARDADTPVCAQCHILDALTAPPPQFVAIDWPTPDWPQLGQVALPGAPQAIPHSLQFRGNCVACHAGMGAVFEVRTTHPEQANCRQCHTHDAGDPEPFSRTVVASQPSGGAP